MTTGEGRVLRGAIAVDQVKIRIAREKLASTGGRENVAPGEQLIESTEVLDSLVDHGMEKSCRKPERVDLESFEGFPKRAKGQGFLGKKNEPPSIEKRTPDLEGGGVESDWRMLQGSSLGSQIGEVIPDDESQDGSVGNQHALGLSRSSRGIEQVGRIIGSKIQGGGLFTISAGDRKVFKGKGLDEEIIEGFVLAQQETDSGVLGKKASRRNWIAGIERQVAAACFEDAKKPDDEFGSSFACNPDWISFLNSILDQAICESIRLPIQSLVGEKFIPALDRDFASIPGRSCPERSLNCRSFWEMKIDSSNETFIPILFNILIMKIIK